MRLHLMNNYSKQYEKMIRYWHFNGTNSSCFLSSQTVYLHVNKSVNISLILQFD